MHTEKHLPLLPTTVKSYLSSPTERSSVSSTASSHNPQTSSILRPLIGGAILAFTATTICTSVGIIIGITIYKRRTKDTTSQRFQDTTSKVHNKKDNKNAITERADATRVTNTYSEPSYDSIVFQHATTVIDEPFYDSVIIKNADDSEDY